MLYFYDGEDIVQTFDGATVVNRYVHGPGVDDLLQGMDSAGGAGFPLTDGLGSLTEFESNGAVFMRSEYSPFGAQTSTYNPYSLQSPYGYTGREHDDVTGLMFYRSRYYSPEQRRFVQEDKWRGEISDPATYVDKYLYVYNNPIIYIDPEGERRHNPFTEAPLALLDFAVLIPLHFWRAKRNFKRDLAKERKANRGNKRGPLITYFEDELKKQGGMNWDEYAHCNAHCEVTQKYGVTGVLGSEVYGYLQEYRYLDTQPEECAGDILANRKGVQAGLDPQTTDCAEACSDYCQACYDLGFK